jgi:hypothetical protein
MATELGAGTIGMMQGYCDNEDCSVREVTAHVKLYDEKTSFTEATPWCCPKCRTRLSHVGYQTAEEYEAEQAWHARTSVNEQRYRRDHPGSWVGIPVSVMLDDSLPA